MLIETEDYITAAEAAKILRLSRSAISQLCKKRTFTRQIRFGRFWILHRKEVEAFARWRSGFSFY